MTLVFPMAGLSSRFTKVGYEKPKYMLPVENNSVFYHAVNSFKSLFNNTKVVFICRNIYNTEEFIEFECKKMNLVNYEIVILDKPTDGQAETVYLGLKKINIDINDSLLIFNIDTFRPNFILPSELDFNKIDGYLEVFNAEGNHWSFILSENAKSNKVVQTAEKERISDLCSSGLYYFKYLSDFNKIFEKIVFKNDKVKNEFFIAPMYNYMIAENKDIRYSKILLDEIIFCGTPDEYSLLTKGKK